MDEEMKGLIKEVQALVLERYRATALLDDFAQEIQARFEDSKNVEYQLISIKASRQQYEHVKSELHYDSLEDREKQLLKCIKNWKFE